MTTKQKRNIFRISQFLIAALLFVLLWLVSSHCNQGVELLFKAILILSGLWFLLSSIYHFVKKSVWIVVAFCLIYLFGVYIYRCRQPECLTTNQETKNVNIIKPINEALSVFYPSRGDFDEKTGIHNSLDYQLLHLSSFFFLAMVGFAIFGRRLMNRSGYSFTFKKHRNIFWGYSEAGMLLAKDILKNDNVWQQCVFMLSESIRDDKDKDKLIFDKIDKMGAIVLYQDFDSTKKKLAKGRRHFFLTEDQDFNVRMALKVSESSTENNSSIHLYIRTEQERIDNFFSQQNNVELHFFNQSDLTARYFVEQHPMLTSPGITIEEEKLLVNGNFSLLLLGFGWQGRELLNKCICDAQFKGSSFKATIIDKGFEPEQGDYPLLYNEYIKKYNLIFNPKEVSEVGSSVFYKWLNGNITNYNRIIISLGDDHTNIETAVKLARILQNKGKGISNNEELQSLIFAHVQQKDKYGYYKDKKMKSPITIFGDLSEIYTHDVVVNESMDRMAKMVNYVYSKWDVEKFERLDDKWDEIEAIWECESIFNKNSSRAVSMNVRNIYEIIGEEWSILENKDKLEILAENEHLRWNAFHLVNGIRKWYVEDINTENAKLKDKNDNLLKHGCLVDFDELPLISEKVNTIRKRNGNMKEENYQETDRRITRHFPLLYKEMNK